MDGMRALDILPLLNERFALLSGGRDNRGGPIICFPATTKRERIKPEDIKRVVSYFINIPSRSVNLPFFRFKLPSAIDETTGPDLKINPTTTHPLANATKFRSI
uniref:Uncharacterized protein n=1 Tax=Anopheles farauti TaxID=69004 RepID=A0A182Q6B3_9DIPT